MSSTGQDHQVDTCFVGPVELVLGVVYGGKFGSQKLWSARWPSCGQAELQARDSCGLEEEVGAAGSVGSPWCRT